MAKKLTIVNSGKIYKSPDTEAQVIAEANIYDIFSYNRPMKRNKGYWYEIQISRYQRGYIKQTKGYVWERIIIVSWDSYCIPIGKDYSAKIELPFLSRIYKTYPRRRADSSYRVQTKKGIIGVMPADTTKASDIFLLIMAIVNFIIAACYTIAILLLSIELGAFIPILAQLSLFVILAITNVVLIILFVASLVIKLIISEIRMRL